MSVKGNHPLAEIIAKKLFSIENVPAAEQRKMVNRACKAAVEYTQELEKQLEEIKKLTEEDWYSVYTKKGINKRLQQIIQRK